MRLARLTGKDYSELVISWERQLQEVQKSLSMQLDVIRLGGLEDASRKPLLDGAVGLQARLLEIQSSVFCLGLLASEDAVSSRRTLLYLPRLQEGKPISSIPYLSNIAMEADPEYD